MLQIAWLMAAKNAIQHHSNFSLISSFWWAHFVVVTLQFQTVHWSSLAWPSLIPVFLLPLLDIKNEAHPHQYHHLPLKRRIVTSSGKIAKESTAIWSWSCICYTTSNSWCKHSMPSSAWWILHWCEESNLSYTRHRHNGQHVMGSHLCTFDITIGLPAVVSIEVLLCDNVSWNL